MLLQSDLVPPPSAKAGPKIRLASPCNIWGRAFDDFKSLASLRAGALVDEIEPAEA